MTVSSRSTTDRSPSAPSTRTASSPRARPVLFPPWRKSLNLGAENVLPRRPDRTVTKAPDWRERSEPGWGDLCVKPRQRSTDSGALRRPSQTGAETTLWRELRKLEQGHALSATGADRALRRRLRVPSFAADYRTRWLAARR